MSGLLAKGKIWVSSPRCALPLGKGTPAPELGCWPGEGADLLNTPELVSSVENPGPESGTEFLAHSRPPPPPPGSRPRGLAESALALCYFFSVSPVPVSTLYLNYLSFCDLMSFCNPCMAFLVGGWKNGEEVLFCFSCKLIVGLIPVSWPRPLHP